MSGPAHAHLLMTLWLQSVGTGGTGPPRCVFEGHDAKSNGYPRSGRGGEGKNEEGALGKICKLGNSWKPH